MNPTVTIIMATYNRAHFIVETLHSIQKQTFENWECLIVDDGGTDNTFEVIGPIIAADTRFKFSKRPEAYKKGLPGCRNYGLDNAKGAYIIFFDDDDYIHPNNLQITLQVIESEKVDFCHYQKLAYSDTKPEVKNSEVIIKDRLSFKDIEAIVIQQIGIASCTVLWDKKCFEKVRFNEDLLYAEEWECYIRIISAGFEGVIIENILYYNRKHLNSNTGEFYTNNPIRRESKKEAILLVLKNLKETNLLSPSLIDYFIRVSTQFAEYNLFESIINIVQPSFFKRLQYDLFYKTFPYRFKFYKLRKKFKLTK